MTTELLRRFAALGLVQHIKRKDAPQYTESGNRDDYPHCSHQGLCREDENAKGGQEKPESWRSR